MFLSAIGERVAVDAIRLAPKQLYSGAVGWAARRRLPSGVRAAAYSTWARAFRVELDEVELPLRDYPSFGSFFARRLRADARPVDATQRNLISPCDGRILGAGEVGAGQLLQAKGRRYDLSSLLADESLARSLHGGQFVTIYLSPRDYHRVHVPCDAKLTSYAHVPGTLWPVSPFFAERVDSLFCRNERIVAAMSADFGPFAVVMVGAAGVGNMTLSRPRVESRHLRSSRQVRRVELEPVLSCERGSELGAFELGSTVILLLPKAAHASILCAHGDAVRFGEPLFELGATAG